nr:hypothetical protein [Tanacetum cinerariifolium]
TFGWIRLAGKGHNYLGGKVGLKRKQYCIQIKEGRFKECSSCGALYNKSCGYSKGGFVDKFVRDTNKTPDSSQRPFYDCPKCGNQDPGENSSQSPPHIDHHCCNGCGDSLDGIFYRRCTYSSIISSSKIDSFLDEFAGKLIFLKSISPGINEADCDREEEIRLIEKLLYDNSSPRPLEEFNPTNSDVVIESFSPSHIPVEDSDSLIEEIDLSFTPDDSMPPSIENDDYDSERDIIFLEELLSNGSLSLPENESFHFDVPSSPRPPVKPPNDGIYFEPDTGAFTVKVDFLDFEDSCSWFCPSITRSSNPQLQFGNPISKSYRLTFIFVHT